ncbi:hypothetical protein [Janthinobacterium sp. RB2R34]|uniref:hypothetical protein n=1 Tax=Janthinobacterium sp. RB2R34 TaxID=3424193 RepID=UPI003F274784
MVILLAPWPFVATLVFLQSVILAYRAFVLLGLLAAFVRFMLGLLIFALLLFARFIALLGHGALLE